MEFSMVNGAKKQGFSPYGGHDPAEIPLYTRIDASRAIDVPASTISAWVHGMYTTRRNKRAFYEPLIKLPDDDDPRLSFNNLLEVFVLRALRKVQEIKIQTVRTAIINAEREHRIERLLIHPNLRASGGDLFLDFYFRLVDLSNSKQLAMRQILEHSLQRVEVENDIPMFFPLPRYMPPAERPILVSPYISFGNAVLERRGISTYAVRSRIDAGEKKESVIADYDLRADEFEEAILYEAAA
jgi:uncharacterized protein (DUF433 family)